MPRQVYYDPFGMRLQGEHMGMQDEIGLQSATRQARLADWQYSNELPIQLQAAKRDEAYQQFYDPYRRNAATVGNDVLNADWWDNERRRREAVAMTTGNYGMVQAQDQARYPTTLQPGARHAVPSPANLAFDDWNGVMKQEGINAADPVAMHYQNQFEDMYGLPRGTLMRPEAQMGPQTYTQDPSTQIWQDPRTGILYHAPAMASNAYEQRAWMPEAQRYAEFGLRQDANARANDYLQVQERWQQLHGMPGQPPAAATAGTAPETGLGYYSGD